MSDSLNILYKKAGEGNKQAFHQLVQHAGNKLFHIALYLCKGNESLAEDALQNALIKLWTYAPKWEEKSTFSKYASSVVYTCCMDAHRQTKFHSELTDDVIIEFPKAEKALKEKEQRQALTEKLKALPERQRDAILLSFYFDKSQKDVAAALGTTEKAVESLLIRAKKSLKESISHDEKEALL
jgi:RNA polymerase sigma-70 factor (ECF subfamily)